MKSRQLHEWVLTPRQAAETQQQLASRVSRDNRVKDVRLIAGVDALLPVFKSGTGRGAVVVLSYPELKLVEARTVEKEVVFPYVPGLLSFREAPLILEAFGQLVNEPDLVMADGQGIAHPRRFGIASHLGVLLDIPSIGCAKSRLTGEHAPPEVTAGSRAELVDNGEVVGVALRTRTAVAPVYVSIGHKIDLETAITWVLRCCRGFRLPEPARLAHQAAGGRIPAGVQPVVPGARA